MNLPKRSNEKVDAQYCESDIPQYQNNGFIAALGPILPKKTVGQKLQRVPPFDPKCRAWPAEKRIHLLPDIDTLVVVLSDNYRFEQLISVMSRQGYRPRVGSDFYRKIYEVDEVTDEMMAAAKNGQIVGSAQCAMVHSITGRGKTTMLGTTMALYPEGVIIHHEYQGKPFNHVQIPFLAAECAHDASVHAILENMFAEIKRLTGHDLLAKVKETSAAKLIPHLVKGLLKFSTGMLIIDEAQVIASKFSGGDATLLYFWISLMNQAGIPLLLLCNPEILKITDSFAKAGMRFCSGGEMALYELPRYGEWQVLLTAAWEYQYLKVKTELTKELADMMYRYSCGIPRATLMLYRFTQQLAIEERKDEVITLDLIRRAAQLNMRALQKMLDAVWVNTAESRLGAAYDLGVPSPVPAAFPENERTSTDPIPRPGEAAPAPAPASSASTNAVGTTSDADAPEGRVSDKKGSVPPPRPPKKPKRGKVRAHRLVDYLDKKVTGEYSQFAAMLEDGVIKRSTEFLD